MANPKDEGTGESRDDFLVDRFVDELPDGAQDDSGTDADDAVSPGAQPQAASLLPAQLQRIERQLELLFERLGDAPPGGGRSGDADATGDPAALIDDLKLVKSNLAGLSERVESLERRLSEKFKPIEEAAQSVHETTQALAATGKTLETSARASAWAQAQVQTIKDGVATLKWYALLWSVVIPGAALVFIGVGFAQRHGLL